MHTGRPVDLLPDRRCDSFADGLAHPGTEVVCRDRASGYAEGTRLGARDAIQVADGFHLLHNLTQAVDRVVRSPEVSEGPARSRSRRATAPVSRR